MTTMRLVAGDDWEEIPVAITDNNRDPYPLTGLTITGEIEHALGTITLTVVVTNYSGGLLNFSASDALTSALPVGSLSKMTFTAVDGAISKTLFCVNVEGVTCL